MGVLLQVSVYILLASVSYFYFILFFEPIYIPEYKPETKPGRSYEPLPLRDTNVN
jgi:hypothetical protein